MDTDNKSNEERGKCWQSDFSVEFPISYVDINIHECQTRVLIGPPHSGYKIITHFKNQRMHGESTLLSDKNVLIATLEFVEGVANGPCKIYDEWGTLFFEGSFVNGYRQGKGKEYDEKGKLVYEGLYERGRKLVKMTEMEGYWKEYDDSMNLISVCRKDVEGRNNGVCFFFQNGSIAKISEWHEGREYPFLGYFKLYDELHNRWIDGFYNEGRIFNYSPMTEMEGFWKEYDTNGNLIHICEIDGKGNHNGICYNFVNGILRGVCHWKEGRKTPYNGYYKVYNTFQNQWMEGYYENGKRLNMVRLDEMNGYWKEYDENDNLKSICKKDKYGRYEDICYFYENGSITKISEWHEGIEISLSGSCKVFDEPKKVWYEGGFRDGLREGKCIEYDTSGKKIFKGFYKNGNKLIPMKNKKHFWEERDNQNKVVRICQIDAHGRYCGLSYQYRENQIIRVSRWKEDKEIELLKLFSDGIMTEYKNGKKIYSGEYVNQLKSNYQREGEGEEFDIDGETLLYRGRFIKGERDGHGRLYGGGIVIFDGEWKKGMKKFYYLLYFVLTLVFMLLTSAACFIFFNAYVGAILVGIYITAICFYYNQNAGFIASGLFIVMCCFFIHFYAGIIASVVFVITISFCLNIFAGFVPTGLVIIALCLYLNTYLGIFAIGLFLIYLIFLTVHFCKWKRSIIWSSAIYILSLCTIITLILTFKKAILMKYVIVFAVGILLILILSLISGCNKDTMKPLMSSTLILLDLCVILSLLMHPVQPPYFKYVIISLVGLFLICMTTLIAFKCEGSITIVLKCSVVIVVSCVIANTAIGSISVPALKYVSVFASGWLLIFIVCFFSGCNKENMHINVSSSGLIISCCVLASFLLSSMKSASMKYYLVFVLGIIIFFLIYLFFSLIVKELKDLPVLFLLILAICGITDLIMTSFEVYNMRFFSVIAIGFIIILLFFVFTKCGENNPHALVSGVGTVLFGCYMLCWLIGGSGAFFSKYLIVFAVSSLIVFFTYFVLSFCEDNVDYAGICAGIEYIICLIVELIIGSIENETVRFISIFLIGIVLIVILLVCSDCLSNITMLGIFCIIAILFACSGACFLLGGKKYSVMVVIFYSLSYLQALFILICCCCCCCYNCCDCCDD